MIIVQTTDGFFEVWQNGRRVSGEYPFVSSRMAQGWIENNQHLAQVESAVAKRCAQPTDVPKGI